MPDTVGSPARRSLSTQTLINMLAAGASGIGGQLAVLAATPYLIWTIGLEGYGFWALCSSISRYGMLTDVLFAPIITNVAYAAQSDDRHTIRQIATFAGLFYGALLALFVPISALVGRPLLSQFHLSESIAHDAPAYFTGYVGFFFGSIAVTGFASVLNGLGLLRKSAAVAGLGSLVFTLAAIALAARGLGMWALLYAAYVQLACMAVAYYILCRRALGAVFVAPTAIEGNLARRLLSFGGWVQVSTLASLLCGETGQILIGLFIGVPAVGLFEAGAKVARAIRSISSFPNSALLPSVASIAKSASASRLVEVVIRTCRLVAVVTVFVAAVLVGSSSAIVAAWLGPVRGGSIVAEVLVVLTLNYLIETIASVPVTVMRGIGRPKPEAAAAAAGSVVNVVLTFALIRSLGVTGVLIGTLAGTMTSFVIFYAIFARAQETSLRQLLASWLPRLALAGFACAALAHLVLSAVGSPGESKVERIAVLLLAGSCAAGLYGLVLWATRFFTMTELRRALKAAA